MRASAVVKNLKDKGFRITPIRKQIIEILSEDRGPLTSLDILTIIHKTGKKVNESTHDHAIGVSSCIRFARCNKTTVYRQIAFLLEQEILEEINLGEGKNRYDLVENKAHHHHLTCNNCGVIKDLPLEDNDFLQSIEKNTNFRIQKHSLELFGLCLGCQK
ncbi:MAG: Fur family transcriptional regulator [Candidatus Curtissbacteria bacterium]|nr:Fur family transcriptional regulator [Candidatus Curtissbacteria bacterium]